MASGWNSPLTTHHPERTMKTRGLSYFSVQEMENDPIKFMLQIKGMKEVPENLLKLKTFREHLSSEQEVRMHSNLYNLETERLP